MTGRILALVDRPDLAVIGQAYPHSFPNPQLTCPDAPAGSVSFGVLLTAPATAALGLIPEGGEGIAMAVPLSGNEDAWEAGLADAADASELPTLLTCMVLTDLLPNTNYTARIRAVHDGEMVMSDEIRFNSGGAPVRPAAEFLTLGANWAYIRAMHTADQRVLMRAYVLTPDSTATCGDPGSAERLVSNAGWDLPVEPDEVAGLNAPPEYNERLIQWFRVPEGTNVLFCARWYPSGSDTDSFEREEPLFESFTVMGSPDRILPRLDIMGDSRLRGVVRVYDVEVVASTASGLVCGTSHLDGDRGWTPGLLCDGADLATASAVDVDNRLFSSRAFDDNITLTTTMTKADGTTEVTTFTVPGQRWSCFGVCELPPWQAWEVPIGNPDADCGSNSPFELNRRICTPIAGTEEGSFTVLLSWQQGNTNGIRGEWSRGEVIDRDVDWTRPDYPRMNTDERLVSGDYDPVTQSGIVSLRLEVDRPSTYRVQLFTIAGSDTMAPLCQYNPTDRPINDTLVGSVETSVVLFYTDLCRGQFVTAQVLLTDPVTGLESMYRLDFSTGETQWGSRSTTVIPGLRVEDLHFEWTMTSTTPVVYEDVTITGGRAEDRHTPPPGDECTGFTELRHDGVLDDRLSSRTTFHLGFNIAGAGGGCASGLPLSANFAFTVDLYTLMTTGEQRFTIAPPASLSRYGESFAVRVWIE